MSNNVSSADNQQGSLRYNIGAPSETTRRAPISHEEIKAYFLGAIHDGTYNQHNKRYRISQKGTGWLNTLKDLLKEIGFSSWIYKEGRDRDVFVLETLASFLDISFDPLKLKTKNEKRAYIRGFFDAEGGIPHDLYARFYIQLTQNDFGKLQKLKKFFQDLSIKTGKIHNPSVRVAPEYWRMYILAESHKEFIAQINSWHPNKRKIFENRMKI